MFFVYFFQRDSSDTSGELNPVHVQATVGCEPFAKVLKLLVLAHFGSKLFTSHFFSCFIPLCFPAFLSLLAAQRMLPVWLSHQHLPGVPRPHVFSFLDRHKLHCHFLCCKQNWGASCALYSVFAAQVTPSCPTYPEISCLMQGKN